MPYDFFIYQHLLQGEHKVVLSAGKERMCRLFPIKRKTLTLMRAFTEERETTVDEQPPAKIQKTEKKKGDGYPRKSSILNYFSHQII